MSGKVDDEAHDSLGGDVESEAMFARAFQLSPAALSISRLSDDRFLEVNEACCKLFEYQRAEFIGRNAVELQLWHRATDREAFFEQFHATGSVRDLEIIIQTRRGARLTVLFNAEQVLVGAEPCMIASIYDITSKRHAERLQRQTEAQLRQMQKLEALGTLAGGIAHDFNNILTVVGAVTELLAMDLGSPETMRSHLGELRSATHRAKELVKQVLTFSRRHKQDRQVLDLRAVIEDAVTMLRRTLPSNIEIKTLLEDEPILVLASSDQLNQVLMNLGTNGAQAMGSNSGVLTIELKRVLAEPGMLKSSASVGQVWCASLSVHDEGIGMDEETLLRIFEPFYTTKKLGEGTGLGLAVVHGIVREHDGTIEVRSRPGEGTRMVVNLPLHDGKTTPTAVRVAGVVARGNGEHILFVDDEDAVGRACAGLLARIGYRVTVFDNAVDALARFTEDPYEFELVITDLTMPKMTGDKLARAILELRPKIPIIMITGYSAGLTQQQVRNLGVLDLIQKPLTLEVLAETLHRALYNTDFDMR